MFEVDPCLPDPPLRSIPHFPHLHSNRPNQSKLAENSGLFLLKLILTSHGQHNNKNISRVKNCPEITILSSQIGHCSDRGKAPNLSFRCFFGFCLDPTYTEARQNRGRLWLILRQSTCPPLVPTRSNTWLGCSANTKLGRDPDTHREIEIEKRQSRRREKLRSI